MREQISGEMLDKLYGTLIKMQTKQDCEMLLADLCSANEVLKMAQRLEAAEMLLDGCTYAQIIEHTDISSATLSRVSACVRRGSGGYKKFVEHGKK